LALPSTEEQDLEPTFSFSVAASTSGLSTPTYVRADSLPATGVPPRLQTQGSSLTDYSPSEAASSPCTVSADFSIDVDLASDSGVQGNQTNLSSAHHTVHRALMGGAADNPHRSSSPLKRPASSMEPEQDNADGREDVDMIMEPDLKQDKQEEARIREETMEDVSASAPTPAPDVPVAETIDKSDPSKAQETESAHVATAEFPLRTGMFMADLSVDVSVLKT